MSATGPTLTMTSQQEYDYGIAVCHEYHPPNDRGVVSMTKSDIIHIVGRKAAEVSALAKDRDDWKRAYDQERAIWPSEGVWMVEMCGVYSKSSLRIAQLGELPDPMPLASIMRHRDLICRVLGEQWEAYRAGGSQSRWDVAEAIMRAVAVAETPDPAERERRAAMAAYIDELDSGVE